MNCYRTGRGNLFLMLLILAGCLRSSAAAITITNPSFESPAQLAGGFTVGSFAGWASAGNSGVFRPIIGAEFNSIPDGLQTGYSNSGALSQILSDTLFSSTLYTLQVDVGKRLDCCTFFGAVVQLWAGSTLLATAPAVSPAPGNFVTATLTYTSLASDPSAGQALKIVLDSIGNQTDFDNVLLDGTGQSTAVPEPASIGLLCAGCLILFACRRLTIR